MNKIQLPLQIEEANYHVEYTVDKEVNEAQFEVWVEDKEPFKFRVTGLTHGINMMHTEPIVRENEISAKIVEKVRDHAGI